MSGQKSQNPKIWWCDKVTSWQLDLLLMKTYEWLLLLTEDIVAIYGYLFWLIYVTEDIHMNLCLHFMIIEPYKCYAMGLEKYHPMCPQSLLWVTYNTDNVWALILRACNVHVYIFLYMYIHICVYLSIYIYLSICIYIYICMHAYIHTYMY